MRIILYNIVEKKESKKLQKYKIVQMYNNYHGVDFNVLQLYKIVQML